ncbi:MAG TPA: YceI family protein [Rhodocyclaceae bacterium]|nr:polyisoprenoid-binding protein [Rhodocyclaceae bacterium]HMV55365.1 YceI family protein [Rhodocyclaceae bacterium]HNA04528.1 YceI family protein [Rhodocyclaceae bacterium]HNB80186.1 YceI family protein [Rhodocyclaceae bacterium]HNC62719.1 YceI family protein [Rhodocyclaceae bacterium]
MKQLAVGIIAAALAGSAVAAETFTLDTRHTFPVFEINHLGFSTQRGRFNKTEGKITLDRAAKSGSVEVKIDSASIDMGLDEWDKHMRGEDFFNAEQFPTMNFKADKFSFDGDKPVAAEGTLTLLGVARPVTLKIAGFTCGTHPINKKALCAADISTTIKRSEWGMKKYLPAVSDDVTIKIPVEAFKD